MKNIRKTFEYTAITSHYKYSTIVYAKNISEARRYGLSEARLVMGRCAVIRRDIIKEMT